MKKQVKLLNRITCLVMVVSFVLLSACSDDDDKKSSIDTDDPNAVAQSLTVENGTYVKGSPPAPSSDPNAPVLSYNGDDLFTIQGSKIIVNTSLESGSASGFYVAVDGADGYFNVNATTVTPGTNGRVAETKRKGSFFAARTQQDAPSFSIEVPKNIQPGEFCIFYCVYDAENRVSNIVQQCVTVTALGGDGSAFLTSNQWSMVKWEYYYDNVLEEQEIAGETYTEPTEAYISCQGNYQFVPAEYQDRVNYSYATITSNGALKIEEEYYHKYPDIANSECTVTYEEITEPYSLTGAWSYDKSTGTLVLLYNDESEEIEGDYVTVAQSFKTELVDGNLILTLEFGLGEYEIVTLEPKN